MRCLHRCLQLLLAPLLVASALGLHSAHAAPSYTATITVKNESSTAYTDLVLDVPINGRVLLDANYVSDVREVRLETGTGALAPYEGRSDSGSWRLYLPSLDAYETKTFPVKVDSAAPAEQFGLYGTATVSDAASLNPGTASLTLEAECYTKDGMQLLFKEGAYGLHADSTTIYGTIVDQTQAPSETYASSSSDGTVSASSTDYLTAQGAATGTVDSSSTLATVGQYYDGASYHIYRSFLFFDTSAIPDATEVVSATLRLYASGVDESVTDFDITVQSGMPTYPHDPLEAGDYDKTHYSGDGGSLNTAGWVTSAWNEIPFNTTGRSWVNKAGWTKLALRSSRDISATAPSGYERVAFETAEGTNRPQLVVVYRTVAQVSAALPSGRAAIKLSYSSPDLKLYIDGVEVATAEATGFNISSSKELTVSRGTRFTTMAKVTVGGTPVGHWMGPLDGTTSTDLSGQGNHATVAQGASSSPSGVKVTLSSLSPVEISRATGFAAEPTARMVVATPVAPSGMYAEGSGAHLPFGDVLEEAADAAGVPASFLWTLITSGLAVMAGFITYRASRSMLAVALASGTVLVFFSLTGVLPFWVFLVYALMAVGFIVFERTVTL